MQAKLPAEDRSEKGKEDVFISTEAAFMKNRKQNHYFSR